MLRSGRVSFPHSDSSQEAFIPSAYCDEFLID
jgi:hypothetical protein